RLHPEHAAGAPLAREAMADGNADRRARGGGAELAAAAGGDSSGHRATLPWSSFSTHGAPGSSRYQWRPPWREADSPYGPPSTRAVASAPASGPPRTAAADPPAT